MMEKPHYPSDYCEVTVSGDSFPSSLVSGWYLRPLSWSGELQVYWDPADLFRNVHWSSRQGRALRVQVMGRSHTYVQFAGMRRHEPARPGAGVLTRRSSWNNPQTLSGVCSGSADALDIGLAVVLEVVYTQNPSMFGTLLSIPERFLNR
ncbi:hypothetical protein ABTZ90_02315 [Streptomyces cellulosae]